MRLMNTRGEMSKQVQNSLILINNHELGSIKVNKGRIHKELRYFLGIFSNLIKSDSKLR